jgi:hypothetical protein
MDFSYLPIQRLDRFSAEAVHKVSTHSPYQMQEPDKQNSENEQVKIEISETMSQFQKLTYPIEEPKPYSMPKIVKKPTAKPSIKMTYSYRPDLERASLRRNKR